MEITNTLAQFEAALAQQMALAGGDPSVEAAAEALLAAAQPAVRQMALDLAQQAAAEADAQLPEYRVEVVLEDGEPSLAVRREESEVPFVSDDLAARITLRLPEALKEALETAARTDGESVNSYVVEALSKNTKRRSTSVGRRIQGTVQT